MSKPLELQVVSSGNTVWDRIEEYTSTCLGRSSQHTRDAATHSLSEFSKYLSEKGVSPRSLNAYSEYLYGTGIRDHTVKNRFQWIRGFLKWCWKMRYTKEPLHEYLSKLRPQVFNEPKIILHEEYLRLRDACRAEPEKDWLIVLAYHTGLRLGDCCHLRWSDLDMERQVIKCVPRKNTWKTRKPVYIPWISGSDLALAIEQRLVVRDSVTCTGQDFISPDMALSYSDGNSVSMVHMMRKVFRKAKVLGKSFKHFRSTFESRLANSGMSLSLATQITGRSSVDTLLRYVRVDHSSARDGVGKAMSLHSTNTGF